MSNLKIKLMRKNIFVLFALMWLVTGAKAQMTPEGIIGNCPDVPTVESLVDYFTKQYDYQEETAVSKRNAVVDNFFKRLKEVKASAAHSMEQMPIPSNAENQKRAKQLDRQAANRANAGAVMQKFVSSLTPAQQKEFMKCKNEQEAMKYLQKIGRWEEFSALMSGAGNPNGNGGLTKEEKEWSMKDLFADIEADQRRRDAAMENCQAVQNKYLEAKQVMEQKYGELYGKLEDAIEGQRTGKGSGSVLNLRQQLKDLVKGFYEEWVPKWLNAHNEDMEAWKSSMDLCKKKDRKENAMRRLGGQAPLSAFERSDFGLATMYLEKASDILIGETYEEPEENE
jgi:hypothetical protein